MVRSTLLVLCAAVFGNQYYHVDSLVQPQQGKTSGAAIVERSMTATSLLEPTIAQREVEIPASRRSNILSNTINNEPPTLGEVRKLLPSSVFQVDTATSLAYFAIDFMAVVATMGFLDLVVTSEIYHSMPIWAQALSVAPLQVLTGFAMWCMWCIG